MSSNLSWLIPAHVKNKAHDTLRELIYCTIPNQKAVGLPAYFTSAGADSRHFSALLMKKWNKVNGSTFVHIYAKLGQVNLLRILRWNCPPDTRFEHTTSRSRRLTTIFNLAHVERISSYFYKVVRINLFLDYFCDNYVSPIGILDNPDLIGGYLFLWVYIEWYFVISCFLGLYRRLWINCCWDEARWQVANNNYSAVYKLQVWNVIVGLCLCD